MTDAKNQKQSVGSGGSAMQAGRDIIVGAMTPEQMSKIMVALASQLSEYVAEAKFEQNRRFEELRSSIIEEFSKPQSSANKEAFKDPDFQYVVKEAHDSFARSGAEILREELVRLISERSRRSAGTRVAQILNTSINIAGKLTPEDYAALVLIFIFTRVVINGANSEGIIKLLNATTKPFIADLAVNARTLEYLDTLDCISLNRILAGGMDDLLLRKYGHHFSEGFSIEELTEACSTIEVLQPVAKLIFQSGGKNPRFWFASGDLANFKEKVAEITSDAETQSKIANLYTGKQASAEFIKEKLGSGIEGFDRILQLWDVGASQANVTLLGCALAHSALVGATNWDAPLDIWVS